MTIISTRLRRPLAQMAAVALMAALVTTLGVSPAQAASDWTVDTPNDELTADGDCSLREAIESANNNTDFDDCGTAGGAPHTIDFDDDTEEYEISLTGANNDTNTTGDFDVEVEITIEGGDVEDTIINGGGPSSFGLCGGGTTDASDRVFHVLTNGDLTLENLTVENGRVEDSNASPEFGGGIWNEDGDLSLDGVEVSNNSVCDSTGGNASGGGIASSAGTTTVLSETTVSQNDAIVAGTGEAFGGGIWHGGTDLQITDSTIDANIVTADTGDPSEGGGLWAGETGNLTDSTVSGNDADVGGGIFYDGVTSGAANDLDLEHVTVTDNDEGGIVVDGAGGEVNLDFSLVGDQENGDDCEELNTGAINADDNNLDSDGSCDDAEEGDPELDGLDDNGGATETHLPDDNSDAVDLIDETDCNDGDDQRGEDRPEDNNGDCDAGSVERQDSEDSGGGGGGSNDADDELDVTPETATNTLPGDVTHTLTASFDTDALESDEEELIDFKIISGPNVRGDADETDFECDLSSDECSITYTGNGQPGTDLICAWNDTDDDDNYSVSGGSTDGGSCDTETLSAGTDSDLTDLVESRWATAPTPTPTPTPSPTSSPRPTVIVETLVTIRFKNAKDLFKGNVNAGRNGCVRNRTVLLKRGGTTVGQDKTGSSGGWRVKERNANGAYSAVVKRKVFTAGNGDRVVCRRAKSRKKQV